MPDSLLIVGASVRPWIHSAIKAGFDVQALDFFGDWDAREVIRSCKHSLASIHKIEEYDDSVFSENAKECNGLLVCGGLENRIDVIRKLAQSVPLFGTRPDELAALRFAPTVWDRLEKFGFQVPEFESRLTTADFDNGWLRKRIGSSGGLGVCRVGGGDDMTESENGFYYQSFIEGTSHSAMFVSTAAAAAKKQTHLIGVTRQLVGERRFGAAEFSYCGSIGPVELSTDASAYLARLGQCLGSEFGLVGSWGLDFILNEGGIWPVDLNPRLTASMELYESSIAQWNLPIRSVIDLHVQACRCELANVSLESRPESSKSVEGKAVLFNQSGSEMEIDRRCFEEISSRFKASFFDGHDCGFSVADIPHAGESIKVGQPVLTLRVRGTCEDVVSETLGVRAAEIYECLGVSGIS